MNDSVKDFMENAQKAFEPVGRLREFGTEMFERTVDLQLQIATDVLNYTTSQLEAVSDFEDPKQYLDTQRELVSEYTKRARAHAGAYLETLAEAREAFAGWSEEVAAAATKTAAPAKPAARKPAAPRKKAA